MLSRSILRRSLIRLHQLRVIPKVESRLFPPTVTKRLYCDPKELTYDKIPQVAKIYPLVLSSAAIGVGVYVASPPIIVGSLLSLCYCGSIRYVLMSGQPQHIKDLFKPKLPTKNKILTPIDSISNNFPESQNYMFSDNELIFITILLAATHNPLFIVPIMMLTTRPPK